MKKMKWTFVAAFAAVMLMLSGPMFAQSATATVHGKVNNAAGQVLSAGTVQLTKDKTVEEKSQKFLQTFPIDKNGTYSGKDVAPGDYFAYVIVDGKRVDRIEVTFKAGEDKTLDFDMTRPAFLAAMSVEDKKALEEYKKKNSEAVASNAKVANLNATLKTVREDLTAAVPTHADVTKDMTDMKAAVDAKPDEGLLWITYGDVLQAQGDHLAKVDRDEKKSVMSDEAVIKMYTDSIDAYQKGADLNAASKKPAPADQAVAYNQIGNAQAKMGKVKESSAAFEKAVSLAPTGAGMYYNNEAAILFNAQQNDGALAAAEKAIAADPNRPDPYFIKGQVLIAKSSFDSKTSKLTPPPGCVDAYQKYLELAPEGKNAPAVKEVLASLGEKINTKYKAGTKK